MASTAAWGVSPRAAVFGVVCILAGAVLIGARRPSQPADAGTMDSQTQAVGHVNEASTAAPLEAAKAIPPSSKKRTVNQSTSSSAAAESTATATAASTPSPLPARPAPNMATAEASASTAKSAAAESTKTADVESAGPVTIVGCVASDDDTFWLKDTSGADIPTSRSWKSGFLKKRSSSIELLDAAHTLKLPSYVGQRVSVTGTLTKRTMHPRSVQRVAMSCN